VTVAWSCAARSPSASWSTAVAVARRSWASGQAVGEHELRGSQQRGCPGGDQHPVGGQSGQRLAGSDVGADRGDLDLATNGDFLMATDARSGPRYRSR
jgi:hypothetical protein